MRMLLIAIALVWSVPAFAGRSVKVTDKEVVLGEQIFFDTGKATIKTESHPMLDALATTLAKTKKVGLLEIQCHTDSRGNDEWNLKISQSRAEAIRDYLIGKGIDTNRLRAKGYGETRPIDKGANEKAWAKNRRTQFVIIQSA